MPRRLKAGLPIFPPTEAQIDPLSEFLKPGRGRRMSQAIEAKKKGGGKVLITRYI